VVPTIDLPSEPTFRSLFTRHGDAEAEGDTGASYVGLGDRFDDDRRIVHETTSARRFGWRSPLARRPLPASK
jgi:hypothetical protein